MTKYAYRNLSETRKNHAAFIPLLLPFLAMEIVVILFVVIQGKSLYFLTQERSLFSSFAIIAAAAYMFLYVPIRKLKIINTLDFIFLIFLFLNFYSILNSFLNERIDIIFLKQLFFFICMAFFYIYGRFVSPNATSNLSRSLFTGLILIHITVQIANGMSPAVEPGFIALSILMLFSATYKHSVFAQLVSLIIIIAYMAPIIPNLNRTLIGWILIFLTVTLFEISQKNKLILAAAIAAALSLVAVTTIAIQDYKIEKTESRSLARLNQLISIARSGTTSKSVSISDRLYEIQGVERKFKKEAGPVDVILGFGASARYDAYLTAGTVFNNHNVHIGVYWEYLKRGYLGVTLFVMFNLAVLYSGIRQRDWSFQNRGEIRWYFFWYYIVSLMFWFTWANFYYTQVPVWMYVGMVFARKARETKFIRTKATLLMAKG